MMTKGSNKVQEPEKIAKKNSRLKQDGAHNPPGQDKLKKKKKKKTSLKKSVHNPLDRIRHTEPQKERNVAQQIKKQPVRSSLRTPVAHVSQASKKEQAQVGQIKSARSPALERNKEFDGKVVKRLQRGPSEAPNLVARKPSLHKVTMRTPLQTRAAAAKMAQNSQFDVPQAHLQHEGLFVLASELQILPEGRVGTINKNQSFGDIKEETAQSVRGESKEEVLQEDVTQVVFTEVSESTEPRFITPKEMPLLEDWRPGSLKLDKPPSVDRNHRLAIEIEKQQDRRVAQKLVRKKKQVRHLEGVGEDPPVSKDPSQLTAGFTIIEESARGYAEFLYRPGAAWMNVGSASTSIRSSEPPETEAKPKSCEARKTTEEIVLAISSASARREVMRKELAKRLDLVRKKLLVLQNRDVAKRSQSHRCC